MTNRKTVPGIGGRVGGLAAAKVFDATGHRVTGFERSHDFVGVRELLRSRPDVQTQSPRDFYCDTDLLMPENYPEWPTGPRELHSHADKHKLGRLFPRKTSVTSMDRHADDQPVWTLTRQSASREWQEDIDFVSVWTGQFPDKNILPHPGQDTFETHGGQVAHSSEYADPGLVKDKDVVVLGGSRSATDNALNTAQNGATSVRLVQRENVWRLLCHIDGVNFKHMLYIRAQEQQFNQ